MVVDESQLNVFLQNFAHGRAGPWQEGSRAFRATETPVNLIFEARP